MKQRITTVTNEKIDAWLFDNQKTFVRISDIQGVKNHSSWCCNKEIMLVEIDGRKFRGERLIRHIYQIIKELP